METDIRDIKERSCALRKDILSLQKQNKQLTHHVEQLSKQILRFGQKLSATENILREDRGYISSEYFYALSDYTFSGNQTKKKVLICGYYGARNCGDELMLQSILSNLDSEKGFAFLQRFLKDAGILEDLEKAGIQEGYTVRMYGFDFDYYK